MCSGFIMDFSHAEFFWVGHGINASISKFCQYSVIWGVLYVCWFVCLLKAYPILGEKRKKKSSVEAVSVVTCKQLTHHQKRPFQLGKERDVLFFTK
jgi:hypothetical protein